MSSFYREGASSAFWRTQFHIERTGIEAANVLFEVEEADVAIKLLDLRSASDYDSFLAEPQISLFAHGDPVRITQTLSEHCLNLPRPTGGVVCRELREYLAGTSRENVELTWAMGADRYVASGLIDDVFPPLAHAEGERMGVRGNVFAPYDMHATSTAEREAVLAWLPACWYHAWDFFFTDVPLARVPRCEEVTYLGQGALPEVVELLHLANPDTEAFEHIETRHWYGVKNGVQVLCAVSADEHPIVGIEHHNHLAGLATHPDARGQGLAAAVMVGATNAVIEEGAKLITFGMWGGNHVARRLYARIGYINGGRQYILGQHIEESPTFTPQAHNVSVNEKENVGGSIEANRKLAGGGQ